MDRKLFRKLEVLKKWADDAFPAVAAFLIASLFIGLCLYGLIILIGNSYK